MLLVSQKPGSYDLIDRNGQIVGTVVRPTADTLTGRGAGTVLLVR